MGLLGVQTQLSFNVNNEFCITFENDTQMKGFVERLQSKGDVYRFPADYPFKHLRDSPCYTIDTAQNLIKFTGYRTNNATKSPALAFPSVEAKNAFLELMGLEFQKMRFIANPVMDNKIAAVHLDKDFNGATIHIPDPQLKKTASTNPAGTKKAPSEFRKKYVNNDNLMSIFFIIHDAKALAENLRFDSFDAYMKSQNKVLDKIDECFAYIPFRDMDLYNKINQQRDHFNQSKALKMELGQQLKGVKDPAKRREIESEFLSLRSYEIKEGMTNVLVEIEHSLGSFNQQFTPKHKEILDLVDELQNMYNMIKQSFDPRSAYSDWINIWVKENLAHDLELFNFSNNMHNALRSLSPYEKANLVDAIYNLDSAPLNLANRFLDKAYAEIKKLYEENLPLLNKMNEDFSKYARMNPTKSQAVSASKNAYQSVKYKAPARKKPPVLNRNDRDILQTNVDTSGMNLDYEVRLPSDVDSSPKLKKPKT